MVFFESDAGTGTSVAVWAGFDDASFSSASTETSGTTSPELTGTVATSAAVLCILSASSDAIIRNVYFVATTQNLQMTLSVALGSHAPRSSILSIELPSPPCIRFLLPVIHRDEIDVS